MTTSTDVLARGVSVFRGSTNTTPDETLPLADMLHRIQDGTYQQYVEHLRHLLATEGKARYDDAKKRSIAFTPAGVFAQRANAKLATPSGLLNFDFDHPPNLTEAKARLVADPWIVYAFISPSGDGLKVAVWVDGIVDDATYKHAWGTVLHYFERTYPDLAVANDTHCKDIARLCYVSWDPDLYSNPNALLYAVPRYQPPAPKVKHTSPSASAPLPADRRQRYAQQAIKTATEMIDASVPPTATSAGIRHETRLKASRLLGGYVVGGILPYAEAYAALEAAVARNTEDLPRSMKTIADGLHHGEHDAITLEDLERERQEWLHAHRTALVLHQNGSTPPSAHAAEDQPSETEQDTPKWPLPYSDLYNARSLVLYHGQTLRYCYPWKSWLVWTGTHWQRDTSGAVMRLAKQTVKRLAREAEDLDDKKEIAALLNHVKGSLSAAKLKAMVELAQSEEHIPVQPENLDKDPWRLNCTNWTLNLQTGELHPHQQTDLLTKVLPIAYDADATCPTWERFLWRIMGGSQGEDHPDMPAGELENRRLADDRAQRLITFLQRAIGYSLTGDTREQCLFVLHGSGSNGKSTFLETLQALLGDYAQSTPSASLLAKDPHRHEGIPNDIARLRGARLVTAVEIGEGKRLNEELVKRLTGQDTLTARFLFAEFFDFKAEFKLFIACNHLPQIRGIDHAIWRRIKCIPFTVTIPDAEQDKDLPAKLRGELTGVLRWAVQGCLDWQREGLGTPDEVIAYTQEYRASMDVFEGFLAEECFRLPTLQVRASDLYEAYERWCKATDAQPLNKKAFGMRLAESGFTPDKGTAGVRIWKGIGLPAKEDDLQRSGA